MSEDGATDAARIATDELSRWGFADPGRLRDELTAAALSGLKTTTASLLVEYEIDGEAVPVAGQIDVLVDSDERDVAIVETLGVRIARLADVDDQHAIDEGEGYADAAAFRAAHERYWNGHPGQDPDGPRGPGMGAHGRHADRPRAVPDRGAPRRRARRARPRWRQGRHWRSGTACPRARPSSSRTAATSSSTRAGARRAPDPSFTALIRGDPLPGSNERPPSSRTSRPRARRRCGRATSSRRARTWWTAGR